MERTTATHVTGLDLSAPAFLADPYPTYAGLRARGTHWVEGLRSWVAADYGSVVELSRSRLLVRAPELPDAGDDVDRTLQRVDGAEHARLRSAVTNVFHGAALGRLVPRVMRLADDLVAGICARGTADLMSELAHPMSIRTIAYVLGLPALDLDVLTGWTAAMAAAMGPASSPSQRSSAATATTAILDYVAQACDARRRWPRDDIVTRLVSDHRLRRGEALAMVRLLLCTGSHPMALALGNALLLLARHDGEWDALLRRPALVPRAVEECLRFDPVIQVTSRRAVAAVEVAGGRIRAGDGAILLYGSANRDERVFRHADVFDVTRDPNPHLTLGWGTHACLAPLLARLEVRAILEALLRRRVVIRTTAEPVRLTSPVLRGLERLPARLQPGFQGR